MREGVKKGALLVASLLVGTALVLLIHQNYLSFAEQQDRWHDLNTRFDRELGWAPIPNRSIMAPGNHRISSNSLGFRSPPINHSQQHILILGDSVAWGYRISDHQTVAAHLNQKYQHTQVLNMAVPGYGIDQYYLYLNRHINKTNPSHIVIMVFTGNDLTNTIRNWDSGVSKPLFTVKNRTLVRLKQHVSKYSCFNLFSKLTTLQRLGINPCQGTELEFGVGDQVIKRLLEKINQLADRHDAELWFVILPAEYNFNPQGKKGHLNYFRNLFRNNRYHYVDYYQVLLEENLPVHQLYMDGVHLTPQGHSHLAKIIYQHLESPETNISSTAQEEPMVEII